MLVHPWFDTQVLPHLKPRPGSAETGATVLGAHVEGPFINEARIGAHELKVLQASAPNGYQDFKDVYGFEGETPEAQKKLSEEDLQCVKIITCAPELEGVMETIPDLVKAGITVSVGKEASHTAGLLKTCPLTSINPLSFSLND